VTPPRPRPQDRKETGHARAARTSRDAPQLPPGPHHQRQGLLAPQGHRRVHRIQTQLDRGDPRASPGRHPPADVPAEYLERRDQKLYLADDVVRYFSPAETARRIGARGFGTTDAARAVLTGARLSPVQIEALDAADRDDLFWPGDDDQPRSHDPEQAWPADPVDRLVIRGALEWHGTQLKLTDTGRAWRGIYRAREQADTSDDPHPATTTPAVTGWTSITTTPPRPDSRKPLLGGTVTINPDGTIEPIPTRHSGPVRVSSSRAESARHFPMTPASAAKLLQEWANEPDAPGWVQEFVDDIPKPARPAAAFPSMATPSTSSCPERGEAPDLRPGGLALCDRNCQHRGTDRAGSAATHRPVPGRRSGHPHGDGRGGQLRRNPPSGPGVAGRGQPAASPAATQSQHPGAGAVNPAEVNRRRGPGIPTARNIDHVAITVPDLA
jgi:hypothetical protein